MTLDDLPDAPDPAVDQPSIFSIKAAAMVLALKNMIVQLRAFLATVGILASGSANKIPYRVDLGTAMTDPTAGWLRLNSAAQNAATAMVLDIIGSDNIDYTGLLGTFAASTSFTLGTLRIEKQGDATKFLMFNLTAMTTPAGYRSLTVLCTAYSSANPFAQGDPVVLSFQRNGDKGDMGSFPTLHLREERASGTASTLPALLATGVFRRPINVAKVNSISGASLGTDQFILPAGTFRLRGDSLSRILTGTPGQKYWHKMALYNVTDATYLVVSLNGLSYDFGTYSASGDYVQVSPPTLSGSITLTAPKTIELRHLTTSGAGMQSVPAASTGQVEVYTDLIIEKTS